MYARSNSAPDFPLSSARFASAAAASARLISFSSGSTPSRATSAAACSFTAVWSAIIVDANDWTAAFRDRSRASRPYAMSIAFAVTTIAAICASVGGDEPPPTSCATTGTDDVRTSGTNEHRTSDRNSTITPSRLGYGETTRLGYGETTRLPGQHGPDRHATPQSPISQ